MILFFIVIVIILYVLYYLKTHYHDYKYIEHSCKFSSNSVYNDSREAYAFDMTKNIEESSVFKKYKLEEKFVYFYNNLFKNVDKTEFGFAYSNGEIAKLYVNDNNNIYGIEKRGNKYSIRIYKPDAYFKKEELDMFLGKDKSTLLYTLFNIPREVVVYKKYDQNYNFKLNFYLIYLEKYLIHDYRTQIVTLLKTFKCKLDNIDKWLYKYSDYYLYWIAIGKKNDIQEVTFYYRKN